MVLRRLSDVIECPTCGEAVTRRSLNDTTVPKALLEEMVEYFDIEALPTEVYDRILEALQ